MIMVQLLNAGIHIGNALISTTLSPSFYQPHTLHQYSFHRVQDGENFVWLSSQFNHLPSWLLIPEFSQACTDYFEISRSKKEYLMYTKALLQAGDKISAISLLEKCTHFQWPEVPRYNLATSQWLEIA
jgi:hypothetical protein